MKRWVRHTLCGALACFMVALGVPAVLLAQTPIPFAQLVANVAASITASSYAGVNVGGAIVGVGGLPLSTLLACLGNGTINGCTIGGTTPAPGTFTTLTVTIGGALNGSISGSPIFTGSPAIGDGTGSPLLQINGATGQTRALRFYTAGSQRAGAIVTSDAEQSPGGTYANAGSYYRLGAFNDSGSFVGNWLQAQRGSGALGQGLMFLNQLAAFHQQTTRATYPGGIAGDDIDFSGLSGTSTLDVQPVSPLAAGPIATVNGSNQVTVTWNGCCGGSEGPFVEDGPAYIGNNQVWVKFAGLTAFNNINLADGNWHQVVQDVDANHLKIIASTNANATGSGGGGGSGSVQPSFPVQYRKEIRTCTTGAAGFPCDDTDYFIVNPLFYQVGGQSPPNYQAHFRQVYTPNDPSGANSWTVTGEEDDYFNRGPDSGYFPYLYSAQNTTIAHWVGPQGPIASFAGSGTGTNWNTIFGFFTNFGPPGSYDLINVQSGALTSQTADPAHHGGVFADLFGSFLTVDSYSVTSGSNQITFTIPGGRLAAQSNGSTIYLPVALSLNGTTIAAGSYTISNLTATTFTLTGTGNASSSGTASPTIGTVAIYPANLVPYAAIQPWGEWAHAPLMTNALSKFDDGAVVHTQPGNALMWDDGTGQATVNGQEVTPGNIDVVLAAAGSGLIRLNSPIAKSDSGTTLITAASPTIPATYEIALFDPTSNAINAAIQACNTGKRWDQAFKDATKQAATHNITLTPSAGTIDGSAAAVISTNGGVLRVHSNGSACYLM